MRKSAGSPDVVELTVPSDARFLELVRHFVARLCHEAKGLTPEETYQICWGVHEACANVIEHAHRFQSNKPLRLRALLSDGRIEFHVFDTGPGFNLAMVPEPEPAAAVERGRGLYSMRRCMDVVEYHRTSGANCLRLVRQLHTA